VAKFRPSNQSFHTLSQPANDVNVYTEDIYTMEEHWFEAKLTARTESGKLVERELNIPFRFLPLK